MELATERVTDRFGGTRIAASVTELLASHHGNAVRGADRRHRLGRLGQRPAGASWPRAMARLRRRAHRVVWVNPRAAAPGFQPLVGTMAAALPYCDELLPADDVRLAGAGSVARDRPLDPLSSTG